MRSNRCSLALLLTLAACDCGDGVDVPDGGLSDSGGDVSAADAVSMDGSLPEDAARRDTSVDAFEDLMTYCMGRGPLLIPGPSGEERCAGDVAEDVFRFGLCSCTDIDLNGGLTTDSFDSSMGPYMPGESAGSVGTNGSFSTNSGAMIGGALYVADDFSTNSATEIGSNLVVGGAVSGPVNVAGDAFFGRNSPRSSRAMVAGTLTLPPGVDEGMSTYGELVRAPVSVEDPCVCAEADIPDIAGFVAWHETRNDNAEIDLAPAALVRDQQSIDLPCGRYYLNGIDSNGLVTIRVTGRVAIFIEGDIRLNEGLSLEFMDDTGEVDLFVRGDVTSNGAFQLGDERRPSRSRVYVDGGSILFNAGSTLVGNIYAPRSMLTSNGELEVFGSIVAGSFRTNVGAVIHYDSDILRVGEMCEPPESCTSCGDCPSEQACLDGMCGSCVNDSDCCAPLVCSAGDCIPLII